MQEERTVDYLVIAIEAICREIAFDVLILEFLRQGHWSMGIYMLWMVTCYLRPGERPFRDETSKFLYRESAPFIKCFFTQKTDR